LQVLLDTHVWVWSFADDMRIPARMKQFIQDADVVYVSAISLFEIGQKVRIGRWPAMEPEFEKLQGRIEEQGAMSLPITGEIAGLAGSLHWQHRDPFDRLFAASSIVSRSTLITADKAFDTLQDPRFSHVW